MKKAFFFILLLVGIGVGFYLYSQASGSKEKSQVAGTTQVETPVNPTKPTSLRIEKLGVSADVEYVGLDTQNRMDVPKNPDNVAWYELGPKPGEKGSAVIAGHLDNQSGGPAVFWNLTDLSQGDEVEVIDENGNSFKFQVQRIQTYPVDQFPLVEVFANQEGTNLNLVTCEGTFDESTRNYSERTVVYTKMLN